MTTRCTVRWGNLGDDRKGRRASVLDCFTCHAIIMNHSVSFTDTSSCYHHLVISSGTSQCYHHEMSTNTQAYLEWYARSLTRLMLFVSWTHTCHAIINISSCGLDRHTVRLSVQSIQLTSTDTSSCYHPSCEFDRHIDVLSSCYHHDIIMLSS
jgi:hypothetical protein